MARIRLRVEYDGTDYVGWQRQPNGKSIQETLEKALEALCQVPLSVEAAGRTDAGVHARGQVVCFDAPRPLPLKAWHLGLNRLLPEDIAVVEADEVPETFDPRRHSRGKRYRYQLLNRKSRSPLHRRFFWEQFFPLNVPAMREGAVFLLGRHDFSSFRASDCEAAHAVRELFHLDIEEKGDGEICFTVEGTAFLKHMVRNLVGTLVEVGRGKQAPIWVKQVLVAKDRTQAGPTAPAHGLTLMEVFYDVAKVP
jgi:tRNA pseudouridine38-40 synthase